MPAPSPRPPKAPRNRRRSLPPPPARSGPSDPSSWAIPSAASSPWPGRSTTTRRRWSCLAGVALPWPGGSAGSTSERRLALGGGLVVPLSAPGRPEARLRRQRARHLRAPTHARRLCRPHRHLHAAAPARIPRQRPAGEHAAPPCRGMERLYPASPAHRDRARRCRHHRAPRSTPAPRRTHAGSAQPHDGCRASATCPTTPTRRPPSPPSTAPPPAPDCAEPSAGPLM
jgi:hypothetical protein